MIDQSIQHYKILEKIGEGGMGVVYKAEDTRLKRTVALKFLPPHLTKDEEAKTRFITEAQAASALDHQNICTVHQIDETDDEQMYIVMAYYEGETLDKKIERNLPKVLNLREVIDIASQIAAGLARAHEAGITHRDIKPSNIMITKRGEVKILDFGIARIAGQKAITKTDSTLGTVAYMSPEQVKGEPVDHRTDIWSLGVVLYEMLTGQRPFDAEYDQAVMYRIVNEKPAALSKYLDSPNPAIEIFVNQLMEKDLNKRLQTIHDTEHRLHILTKNSNQSQTLSPIVENVPLSNKLIRPTLFVIGIIIAIFLIITLASNDPEKSVISFGVENWITRNNNAYNAYPKWAPNNNILAYHSNVSGNWDIWTGIPGGGMRLRQNRTADFTSDDLYPSWSHDGKRVFFWSSRDGGGLYSFDYSSAVPQKLARFSLSEFKDLQWSQDGSEVAYFRHDDFGNPVIEIYSIESNSSVKIRLDSGKNAIKQTPIYELNWSPDKRFFAFIVARYPNAGSFGGKVWLLRVVDGQLISITDYRSLSTCPQFSQDSRFLFFTANSDIYRQQINPDGTPEGVPELLITSAKARHAHFSLDGKRVAFISQGINPNVWRVRIPLLSEKPAMKSEIKQVTYLDQYLRDFTISPDRATIYFTATLPGSRSYQLWKMQISGNKLQKLSDDSFNYFHPSISPDGETLVYSRTKSTDNYNGSLWTMSLKDGKEHFVYGTASDEQSPQWSPDGNEIVFVKNDDIYTVSIDNRELRRITINGYKNNYARWSPKGRQIAFQSRKDDTTSVWVVSADGGDAKRITSGLDSRPCWSTNGKQLYFIRQTVNQSNIWEVSLENGRERQITDIIDQLRFFPSFLIAHDNSLFFSLLQVTSNITTREVVYQ